MDEVERLTLRYVPRFRCIAGDCKENCCSGLRVQLSEENHRKLEERSRALPQLAARVAQAVKLEPDASRTPVHYSYFEAPDSRCTFLDADWLCSIHRDLGEETLADPCSTFPRLLAAVDGRLELSATFACPEAARLCLTEEGAVDLVAWEPGLIGREIVARRHDATSRDPYVQQLDQVRQLCLDVASEPSLAPHLRALVLCDFAQRIEPFFHAGTSTFEAALLSTAADGISGRVDALEGILRRAPAADARAVRTMKEIFIARLPGCDNARFNRTVRPMVLKDPAAASAEIATYFQRPDVGVEDEALQRRYLERRGRLGPALLARADEHFHRFLLNAIIKDWYTQRPTLGSALRRLVVRAALSRFATVMHPALEGLVPELPEARALALLDEAAVDAFQIVSKNIEHVPTFMDLCEAFLEERRLASLEGLALLLKI